MLFWTIELITRMSLRDFSDGVVWDALKPPWASKLYSVSDSDSSRVFVLLYHSEIQGWLTGNSVHSKNRRISCSVFSSVPIKDLTRFELAVAAIQIRKEPLVWYPMAPTNWTYLRCVQACHMMDKLNHCVIMFDATWSSSGLLDECWLHWLPQSCHIDKFASDSGL